MIVTTATQNATKNSDPKDLKVLSCTRNRVLKPCFENH